MMNEDVDAILLTDGDITLANLLDDAARMAGGMRREWGTFEGCTKVSKFLANRIETDWIHDDLMVKLAQYVGNPDLVRAQKLIRLTALRYPERSHLRGARFEVLWKLRKWSSKGTMVRGRAGPTQKQYRECWTQDKNPPLFRMELNVPYWLMAEEWERERLIHHEMGHCTWKDVEEREPNGHPHDIEEFADTIARFGILEEEGPVMVALAMRHHPETEIRSRTYEHRQQDLFKPLWMEDAGDDDDTDDEGEE